jgi:glycerol-3-phosphate dehydrogenase (NAD(P)+)
MSRFQHVGVVGAGAFGTALALVAHKAGRRVTLFARDPKQADAIRRNRENTSYLPGMTIPAAIAVIADPTAMEDADLILLAAPAQATRAVAENLRVHIRGEIPVVACAKGIERETRLLQTEIIAEILPRALPAALSGPGFAEEIARGMPTAITVAAADLALAHDIAAALATDTFRPYASDDLIGVELGGALKNVLAIAAGVVTGRKLGESARAALIARGLGEMMRVGAALGARAETFMGLSGLGDLVLTATSLESRNTLFGVALGEGGSVDELLAPGKPLVEGAHTAPVAAELARRLGVDAPILAAISAVVAGSINVDTAITSLLERPLRAE